ncbi:MAG: hypothetical protein ACP5QT_03170 [Brevinematia bacterium]
MFGSAIIDVIIGIIFIYSLISLFCTALNETIARFFSLRAGTLKNWLTNFFNNSEMVKRFYSHPLVRNLAGKSLPSYIPPEIFAKVVLSFVLPESYAKTRNGFKGLVEKANLPDGLKNLLLAFIVDTTDSVGNVKVKLEEFFNNAMERVSGWYKRYVQTIILIISFAVCITLNIDTINIIRELNTNSNLRSALSGYAAEYVAEENTGISLSEVREELKKTPMPFGWKNLADEMQWISEEKNFVAAQIVFWIEKILGLIISSFAVSLGAPFWFDTLSSIIRLTGRVPEKK